MSVPKKPTGPITPKGPIKPVAKPSSVRPAAPRPTSVGAKPSSEGKPNVSKPVQNKTADNQQASKPEVKKNEPKAQKTPKAKKKVSFMDIMFLFIIIALIGANLLVHQVGEAKNKELEGKLTTANDEIVRLEGEVKNAEGNLERTQDQLDALSEKSGIMESELTEKTKLLNAQKRKLGSLYATINNLKGNDQFDKSMIDSLTAVVNNMNNQLIQLSKANEIKALEIQTLKSQIAEGAGPKVEELMASELSVTALIEKKGNTEETDKAKKITKMELMFYIDEDEEIKAGLKTLFFRIVDPNGGTVGSSGTVTLTQTGESVDYSLQGHVDYPLDGLESKMWIRPDGTKMKKGTYKLEIYNSDMLIGTKSFDLK